MDILDYLSRATLDIIGLAGFDFAFESLADETNELALSIKHVMESPRGPPIFPMLKARFPILRPFLNFDQTSKRLNDTSRRLHETGRILVAEKKKEILGESLGKGNAASKDLLDLMMRSNMENGEGKGMTDDEILNQIPTLLIAGTSFSPAILRSHASLGHETTSTSIAWALFSLSTNPEIQTRLREELLTVDTDSPSMEQLNALPYLDAVVREALRHHAVVNAPIRVATQDDIIPVSRPYKDRYGVERDCIRSVLMIHVIPESVTCVQNLQRRWNCRAYCRDQQL